jgi:hypothetical protein
MAWYGISKREAWQKFSAEIDAKYINNGFWKGDRVELDFNNWTIVLDTYIINTNNVVVTYTRIRAPFVNTTDFTFRIYRKGIFSDIAKFFGAQDIEIGDSAFDDSFIIKSNDVQTAKALLKNEKIKDQFLKQPQIDLQIKDDDGFWGVKFPEGADELYFSVAREVKDTERLKNLFDLFGETLIALTEMGIAEDTAPNVKV